MSFQDPSANFPEFEARREPMECSDVEILLAEYVDGTLPADPKASVENHLATCASCAELAADAAAAVGFMARSASVDVPAELVTRILFHVPALKPTLARRLFGPKLAGWLEPIFQPRLVMGMGVAALSFFMVAPHVRQLTPSDLDPVRLWVTAENHVNRAWDRGVKSYENIRLVYEIQTRMNEWQREAPEASRQGLAVTAAPAPDLGTQDTK